MSLTVAQVIRKLKKFPPNMKVGTAAHDNSGDELAGRPIFRLSCSPGNATP
jgi:hypothetical protein